MSATDSVSFGQMSDTERVSGAAPVRETAKDRHFKCQCANTGAGPGDPDWSLRDTGVVPVHKGESDGPASDPPVEVGDLIGYRDDGGALHLAVAYMDYPASRADGSYDPKDGFHVAYFSDHPGDGIPRSAARSALNDLRRLTWYLMPFRDQLAQNTGYTTRSREAIDEVLARLPITEFLTCATGKPCPQPGVWIMRGTDRTAELEAGALMPGHPYFENYPPQWTRWDLPLA